MKTTPPHLDPRCVPACLVGDGLARYREQGNVAARCGLSRDCNTHPEGSAAHEAWNEGWCEEHADPES